MLTYTPPGQPARPRGRQAAWDAAPRRVVDPRRRRRRPGVRPRGRGSAARRRWSSRSAAGVGEATAALAAARPSYDVLALRGVAARGRRHVPPAGAGRRRQRPDDERRRGLVDASTCWREERRRAVDVLPRPVAQDSGTTGAGWSSPEFARLAASRLAAGRAVAAGDRLAGLRRADGARCSTPSRCCENVHDGPAPRWDDRPLTRFERRGPGRGSADHGPDLPPTLTAQQRGAPRSRARSGLVAGQPGLVAPASLGEHRGEHGLRVVPGGRRGATC